MSDPQGDQRDPGRRDGIGEATTAAQLFAVLWNELASVLGTAATATLIRRAAKRACLRADLSSYQVLREGWDYRYRVPPEWEECGPADAPGLADLVRAELVPLLREFTGEIVVQRLRQLPALRALGLPAPLEHR